MSENLTLKGGMRDIARDYVRFPRTSLKCKNPGNKHIPEWTMHIPSVFGSVSCVSCMFFPGRCLFGAKSSILYSMFSGNLIIIQTQTDFESIDISI